MEYITPLGYVLFFLGAALCLAIALFLLYDVLRVHHGMPSISRLLMLAAIRNPWVAVLVTAIICLTTGLIIGALLGHWFLGQPV